jgi:2-polyprenyl-3-methyl-5-hydroxy-6-metoxy-1,4-benzoquinol methylase
MTGIDYDERKIAVADHCYMRNENIHFLYADVLNYPFENYDCIILADILHYLQSDQQEQVIEKCIQSLNPGGSIVIRDGNADLKTRHRGTKLTEFFSTRLIGFNKTSGKGLSFLSGKMIRALATKHLMELEEIDTTKFTSNIVFVIKRSAEQKDEAL